MSTLLIRSATSQPSSYLIDFTRLGGPRYRLNPLFKIMELPGIEPLTSWSVIRYADPLTSEAVVAILAFLVIGYWLRNYSVTE